MKRFFSFFQLVAVVVAGGGAAPVLAQGPVALTAVEPGLERAVRWKWWVEPSNPADWGLPVIVEEPMRIAPPAAPQAPDGVMRNAAGRPTHYEVRRGDALVKIGRQFDVPVEILKEANGLTSNLIRVGDVLRIPTPAEVAAARPAPVVSTTAAAKPTLAGTALAARDTVTLQVFLDREGFSVGPINGQRTPIMDRVLRMFQESHPDWADPAVLLAKAREAVPEPLTTYTLRRADFRFIAPPRAEMVTPGAVAAKPTPKKKGKPVAEVEPQARPTYDELESAPMLAYRTPWEFVAERFHCDERYLRSLNPGIDRIPAVGTEFQVPNVVPLLLETVYDGTLQPPADPREVVSATVVDRSILEITRGGRRVAVMPASIARPGLRGRSAWTVLTVIPRPQMVTMRESTQAAAPVTRIYGRETPGTTPVPTPTPLQQPQTLAPGPNNPVGLFWINLALGESPEPLPYGLHGTSIPEYMETQESLGGIRLTNWDIARAVRLLPVGTPITWRQGGFSN